MGAGDSIREYNATAASNTALGGINLSEGVMVPSDLNNAIREVMSHLKDLSDGTTGIDLLSLVDDDASAAIKLQAPAAVTTTTTFTLPDGDGTNGQVISTDGSGQLGWSSIVIPAAFASGMVMPFAGTSAPSGWLLTYGQAVSRTTYAELFSAIGTTYGSGDGSTTFNLPDLRGRAVAGQDDMGGSSANRLTNQSGGLDGDTLGATGGAETHTLTTSQMPSHSHTLSSNALLKTVDGTSGGNVGPSEGSQSGTSNDSGLISGSTEAAGGGAAHNNVQPTIILNYIIKT
jgi:microcystin-dependent protein